MSDVGQREIRTQRRVIAFFQDALGYACLGHWKVREGNSNVEEDRLAEWLRRQRHSDKIIGKVLFELNEETAREIMLADPAVKEGVMTASLFPYRIAFRAAGADSAT